MGYKKFRDYAKEKYGVDMTEAEAKRTRERYFDTYSGIPKWHDKQRRIVHAQGYVRSLSGRIRRLPGIYSNDYKEVAEAERLAINSPVQGLVAEFTTGAIGDLDRMDKHKIRTVGTVHDSILMIYRKKHKKILTDVRKTMVNPSFFGKLGLEMEVPIVVDIETGNWGKGKEYHD